MAFDQDVIDEITAIAEAKGIEVAALLAVAEVESSGSAFTEIGGKKMPLILYEYHVFYRWNVRRQSMNRRLMRPVCGAWGRCWAKTAHGSTLAHPEPWRNARWTA